MPAKGKGKSKPAPPGTKAKGLTLGGKDLPKVKPKKPPPPPKCFSEDDLERCREIFKLFDEDGIERIPLKFVPTMLRKIGFNPKGAELEEIYKTIVEEYQDTIDIHDWYKIVAVKLSWGDEVEHDVEIAFKNLGHDEDETGFLNIETLQTELMAWGEPLTEKELKDFPKACLKEKCLEFETGTVNYVKFVDSMNKKDAKFKQEPINYWKLDQKTLAAMAKAKRDAETAEMQKREEERKAREEIKRKRMIEAGLIQLD